MTKTFAVVSFFLFVFFFLNTKVMAADMNVVCSASSGCAISGVNPLFTTAVDGVWYPGKSITKTLNLKNSGSQTQEMAIKGERISTVNILENVMQISIINGTTVIWSGSVADFYDQEKIGMGIFAPGEISNYDFTVFMSLGAGDEYRNKETVFDLTLGFWEEPISTSGVLGVKAPGELGMGTATQEGQTKPSNWRQLILAGAGGVTFIFFGFQLIKFFMKGGEK